MGTCLFVHKLNVSVREDCCVGNARFWGRLGRTQKRKMGVEGLYLLRRERGLVCEAIVEREGGENVP
ncbi:hypothetical protein SESBI_04692 [Sesbania bispinosa]|nr:hypothetical protein SESBI_04692 [Sesbania bispinosa]